MHAYSNTEFQDPIPVNYKYIPVMFLQLETIRNRLLLQVIHFRNAFKAVALQSSQRLPELLFYTKKSYKILQAPIPAPIPAPILHVHITLHYTTIQRILHPEYNSTCRRQRALRVLLLHTEGKDTFSPDSRKEILCIEGKEIF